MNTRTRRLLLLGLNAGILAITVATVVSWRTSGWSLPYLDGLTPEQANARNGFATRMGAFEEAGNYPAMLSEAKAWQKSHPDDPNGFASEGLAAYYMGDLKTCMADWERAKRMNPSVAGSADAWIQTSQRIQSQHPKAKLAPLVRVGSADESRKEGLMKQALQLLQTKKDAQIEAEVARMIRQPVIFADGSWELAAFYRGLWEMPDRSSDEVWQKHHQLIVAWNQRQPNSLLAQILLMRSFTEGAWTARGEGWAKDTSSAQFRLMRERLAEADKMVAALELRANENPLYFTAWMRWAQLSNIPDEDVAANVRQALQHYPTLWDSPIYETILLAPRWGGDEGEWEAAATAHADALGGDAGDILYARIIWWQHDKYGFDNIFKDTQASWPRTKRGFAALLKKYPKSLDVASRYAYFAGQANEPKLAREMEEKYVKGRVVSPFWGSFKYFAQNRMWAYREP